MFFTESALLLCIGKFYRYQSPQYYQINLYVKTANWSTISFVLSTFTTFVLVLSLTFTFLTGQEKSKTQDTW